MKTPSSTPGSKASLEILPVFTAFFIVGLSFSDCFSQKYALAALSFAVLFLFFSFLKAFNKYSLLLLGFSAVCAGAFEGIARIEPLQSKSSVFMLDNAKGCLSGRFKHSFKYIDGGGISFVISNPILEINGQKTHLPVKVLCKTKSESIIPEPEQTYMLHGVFKADGSAKMPEFYGGPLTILSSEPLIGTMAKKAQKKIKDALKSILPPRHAAIVSGFILGDTSAISIQDKSLFKETGISHLMAVSGQHIMVLVLFLASILHWFKVPPISRSLIIVLALVCYALITSGSASVYRALIMYFCLALIIHIEAYPAPMRSIALAALLILLCEPSALNNAAFQLSFIAVIGIISLSPPLEEIFNKIHLPSALSRYLAAAFAANIAIMPIAAHIFGAVSLASIVINPLILWSFSYVLPLSFFLAPLSFFWPAAAILIAPALSLSIEGILKILEHAVMVPGHYVITGNISAVAAAAWYAFILLLLALYKKYRLKAIALSQERAFRPPNMPKALKVIVKTEPKKDEKPAVKAPSGNSKAIVYVKRFASDAKLINKLDELLLSFKRRPLKGGINKAEEALSGVCLLGIENQTLYYQIEDLDDDCLINEPNRIIQGLVYLMAMLSAELLSKSEIHLKYSAPRRAFSPNAAIKNRHLAMAVFADNFLFSDILTRAENGEFIKLVAACQTGFYHAHLLINKIIKDADDKSFLSDYRAVKQTVYNSCFNFLRYDRIIRKKLYKGLR